MSFSFVFEIMDQNINKVDMNRGQIVYKIIA